MNQHRGSKRHMLEWIDQPNFAIEFNAMLAPSGVALSTERRWLPVGSHSPREARLGKPYPQAFLQDGIRQMLKDWWLPSGHRGNTPNWDFASVARHGDINGLVLVEAKANARELSRAGKTINGRTNDPQRLPASIQESAENHAHIVRAIEEASNALVTMKVAKSFGVQSHYQLANRLAFLWKLTSLGVPTTLVYLGFTGDAGLEQSLEPFSNDDAWWSAFSAYSAPLLVRPGADFEFRVGETIGRFLVRARHRLSDSPSVA